MIKEISSTQNAFIKELIQIKEKSRVRRKKSLFLIEGLRELNIALKGNYKIKKILFLPKIVELSVIEKLFDKNQLPEFVSITDDVYKKIAYRETTEGVIALAETKNHNITDLKLTNKNPLIRIGESLEKPGNI